MTNNDALTLGEIDSDGALQETAARAGVTRGGALRRAMLGILFALRARAWEGKSWHRNDRDC